MEELIFFIFILMYGYILKNDAVLNKNYFLIILMAFVFSSFNALLLYLSAKTTRIINFILFLLVTITNISVLMVFGFIESLIFISAFLVIDALVSYKPLEEDTEEIKEIKESLELEMKTEAEYLEEYILPSVSDFNLSTPKEVVETLDKLHFREAPSKKQFIFPVNIIFNFLNNMHSDEETEVNEIEYEVVNEEKMIIKAFLHLAEGDNCKADDCYRKWNKYIRNLNSSESNFSSEDLNTKKEISKIFYTCLNGLFHFYTEDYELSKLYFQSIVESSYSDHFYYDNAVEKIRVIESVIEKRA